MEIKEEGERRVSSVVTIMLVWIAIFLVTVFHKPFTISILNKNGDWGWFEFLLWLIIIFVCIWWAQGWAFNLFRRVTGIYYTERRGDFISAGGYTIAYWTPTITFLLLFAFYYLCVEVLSVTWINIIRSPWFFLIIGTALSDLLVSIISFLAFKKYFG